MKSQFFLFAVIAILAAAVVSGCGGGSRSHTVGTPWDGTIAGVDTLPPDGETGTSVTTWIEVYWPDRYFEPSQTFTFKLFEWTDTGWEAFKTIAKDSSPNYGEWWFAPEHDLAPYTDYKIEVSDTYGGLYKSYFTTGSSRSASADSTRAAANTKNYLPKGGGQPGGVAAEEHVIRVQ